MSERLKALPFAIEKGFLRAVAALVDDFVHIPVRAFAPDELAALEQQDALTGRGQALGERAAPRPAADDHQIVVERTRARARVHARTSAAGFPAGIQCHAAVDV